jgi:hypothetical protein
MAGDGEAERCGAGREWGNGNWETGMRQGRKTAHGVQAGGIRYSTGPSSSRGACVLRREHGEQNADNKHEVLTCLPKTGSAGHAIYQL